MVQVLHKANTIELKYGYTKNVIKHPQNNTKEVFAVSKFVD